MTVVRAFGDRVRGTARVLGPVRRLPATARPHGRASGAPARRPGRRAGSAPAAGDRFPSALRRSRCSRRPRRTRPLLVLVDDAHWFDGASADALLFAARRLAAERVAMLVAARDGDSEAFDRRRLRVDPLRASTATRRPRRCWPPGPARGLAGRRRACSARPAAATRWRWRSSRRCCPSPAARATSHSPIPCPWERPRSGCTAGRSRASPRTRGGPSWSRPSAPRPRPSRVVEALRLLGVDERSLEPAEDAGLLRIAGGAIAFRHPLVRSAVVQRRAALRAAPCAPRPRGRTRRPAARGARLAPGGGGARSGRGRRGRARRGGPAGAGAQRLGLGDPGAGALGPADPRPAARARRRCSRRPSRPGRRADRADASR